MEGLETKSMVCMVYASTCGLALFVSSCRYCHSSSGEVGMYVPSKRTEDN